VPPEQSQARLNEPPGAVYVGTMSAQPRRFHFRRVVIATAFAVPLAAWAASLGGGFILGAGPQGEGCRFFWGESVDGLAWAPAGAKLLVSTRSSEDDDGGASAIRVFGWPGMNLVSYSMEPHGVTPYTIDDAAVVRWFDQGVRDSSAIEPTPLTPMQLVPGGRPTTSNVAAGGPFATLHIGADLSAGGILADARAAELGRPNELCVGTPLR
jgi:hypothetical protein